MSLDRPTKRRTRPGRLRAIDRYLVLRGAALLARPGARFVDFGFGERPDTTLETARALREHAPGLDVVGLEQDAAAVERARAHAEARFVHGGFDALPGLAPVTVVRAMNVLRGYPIEQVETLRTKLGAPLVDGGLLVEGSADPAGALLTAWLIRRAGTELHKEALLFFTDCSRGFAPIQFRDWLPRDLRRNVRPGTWIHALLSDWSEAWEQSRNDGATAPERAFSESSQVLARARPEVDASLLGEGLVRVSFAPPPVREQS